MSDKYGYIGIETLLVFCSNQKDHCVTPNDFMRMNRIKIDERPHGEWEHWGSPFTDDTIANSIVCSICKARYVEIEGEVFNFCPNCGAKMISSNSETEKSNDEKSCLNCGTSEKECELGNRARHGFCGNWTERK